MNSKQMIVAAAFVVLAWFYLSNGRTEATSGSVAQVTDCGPVPGDANVVRRVAWAVCESNKSAQQDTREGR